MKLCKEFDKSFGGALGTQKEDLKGDSFSIQLYLSPKAYQHLKYLADRMFLLSTIEIVIELFVIRMKEGKEHEANEFPLEKDLPITGYQFTLYNKEK